MSRALAGNYPPGLEIAPWWRQLQHANIAAIKSFKTAEEAVLWAQSSVSFDHRIYEKQAATEVVNFRIKELEVLFPDFSLEQHPEIQESAYSHSDSIIEVNGKRLSSIYLYHLNFYLRITQCFGSQRPLRTVMEIGSGYGSLARIFKSARKDMTYIMVDLPESLFYAQNFLTLNFPDAKTKYVDSVQNFELSDYDFVFVPVQFCHVLQDREIDIAINTGSLPEMPDAAIKFWMNFIQNTTQVKLFYSWNYFLNNNNRYYETSGDESSLICPILDPYWVIKYFRLNALINSIDACRRNWLEVCVQRIEKEKRSAMNVEKYGEILLQNAKSLPKGCQYWFANIWMAIWCSPRAESVAMMIEGIKEFSEGKAFGIQNHYMLEGRIYVQKAAIWTLNYIYLRTKVRKLLGLFLKRFSGARYYELDDFSEARFYRGLLSAAQTAGNVRAPGKDRHFAQ